MKLLLIALSLFSIISFAADDNTNICTSLYDEAIYNCEVIMCKDWLTDLGTPISENTIQECLQNSDGDLMEGAQICAEDGGEFEALIETYNANNPTNTISCEDF